MPATAYTSGNIPLAVNLEPVSKYKVLLIGKDESGNPETLVTIPLDVRRAGDFVHTGNSSMNSSFLDSWAPEFTFGVLKRGSMKRYPANPVRHDRNERVATVGIATKISAITLPLMAIRNFRLTNSGN
jgi:hypothetical protein